MQKINFLPQVKAWNAIEFGDRRMWSLNPTEYGNMTYDGSVGAFFVSLPGKMGARWARVLTTVEDASLLDERYVRSISIYNMNDNTVITRSGDVSIYTKSPYNDINNPLATMADVSASISGSTILGAFMDGVSVVDSSYIQLYSDPNSTYDASSNQLATLDSIRNAIADIGTVLELRRAYDPTDVSEETSQTITSFSDWLNYCDQHASSTPSWDYYLHGTDGNWNVKKGNVVIWGNEEYVYIGDPNDDPSDIDNWELFGKLSVDTVVTSFGGTTGAILIDSSSFYMGGTNSNTLKLQVADASHLGGVMTGFEYTHRDASLEIGTTTEHSQRYGEFGLDVSSLNGTHKAYTDIPFQTGHVEAGLLTLNDYKILQSYDSNGAFVAAALIDERSLASVIEQAYGTIYRVQINHNFNQAVMQIGVYKNLEYGRDGDGNPILSSISKQMVYTDEIITNRNNVVIDFGSPQAFIGCQDQDANELYYGYTVVMTVPRSYVQIPDASVEAANPIV